MTCSLFTNNGEVSTTPSHDATMDIYTVSLLSLLNKHQLCNLIGHFMFLQLINSAKWGGRVKTGSSLSALSLGMERKKWIMRGVRPSIAVSLQEQKLVFCSCFNPFCLSCSHLLLQCILRHIVVNKSNNSLVPSQTQLKDQMNIQALMWHTVANDDISPV